MAKDKGGRLKRMANRLCFPESVFESSSEIYVTGQSELQCRGCYGIIEYNEKEICLRLKTGRVLLRGEGLTLKSFGCRCVSVVGEIAGIDFFGEEI